MPPYRSDPDPTGPAGPEAPLQSTRLELLHSADPLPTEDATSPANPTLSTTLSPRARGLTNPPSDRVVYGSVAFGAGHPPTPGIRAGVSGGICSPHLKRVIVSA